MRKLTLTLNPAYDLHLRTEGFAPFHECRADVISRDAGGKGINLSRAFAALGGEIDTVTLVPEEDGEFLNMLEKEGLKVIGIKGLSGRIRENITLHEAGMAETRISLRGGTITSDALDVLEQMLTVYLGAGDVLAICGSLPVGMTPRDLTRLLERMAFARVRLVLDTNGLEPTAIPRIRPFLMKPNREELCRYVGELNGFTEIGEGAIRLRESGVEYAMVSLGDEGAMLACADGLLHAECPRVEVRSTVGAGDSSIAGFLAAYDKGCTPEECLCYAVAAGSAACLTVGTQAPLAEDIAALLPKVKIRKIK